MFNNFFKGLITSLALLASVAANAATDTYGNLLAGSFTPSSSFATLTYSNVGNVYTFTLTANDLNSLFTTDAFIGAIAVDSSVTPTVSNVTGDSPVSVASGKGPGGGFDFRFDLTGPKNARLTSGESVTWTATFASASSVELSASSFALHVQGLTKAQGDSAWYTAGTPGVSAVPEADTYAMMALGLGLMGFVARRRRA
ncbi:FxDxF family PEP-CTERM protein [Methylovorus menthalis]|uniref:FxDxF family PEP-CTERM protein n=1 Tax=Methylovorus menthalis TaxID=1002227 RepID=UPI001E2DCB59|nr:FxDxF family PEP-CTERM protein [Methylovorus menthalis]MCB4810823.1 FxDxF family PEP-CTERM protein [Methylovorus menthalis]